MESMTIVRGSLKKPTGIQGGVKQSVNRKKRRFNQIFLSEAASSFEGCFGELSNDSEDAGEFSDTLFSAASAGCRLFIVVSASISVGSSSSGSGIIFLWKRSMAMIDVVIAISATLNM